MSSRRPVNSTVGQLRSYDKVKPVQIEGLQIRRAEPDDCSALHEIFNCPKVFAGTLQLPYTSRELWRQRLAEPDDGTYQLVAVVGDRVVGVLGVHTFPNKPRRRHAGAIGMGVHDEWQGKGIGTALMRAALELASRLQTDTKERCAPPPLSARYRAAA